MASYFAVERRLVAGQPFSIEMGDTRLCVGHPCGKPVDDWNPRQLAVYGPRDFIERDYYETSPRNEPFPVFSPRLQAAIRERFPGEVQFLPLRLQKPNGSGEIQGFALANVLTVIDCVDRERTPGRVHEGRFFPAGPLTLRDPNFQGGLFRLAGGRTVATNAFKIVADDQNFSGLQLMALKFV